MINYNLSFIEGGRYNFRCNVEPEHLAEIVADGKVVKGEVHHGIKGVETEEKYVNMDAVRSFQVIDDAE